MATVGQGSASTARTVLSTGRQMSNKGRLTDSPFCESVLQKKNSITIPYKIFSAMLTFWQNYSHVRFQDFVGHSKDPFVKAKVE